MIIISPPKLELHCSVLEDVFVFLIFLFLARSLYYKVHCIASSRHDCWLSSDVKYLLNIHRGTQRERDRLLSHFSGRQGWAVGNLSTSISLQRVFVYNPGSVN